MNENTKQEVPPAVAETKEIRKALDFVLQQLKLASGIHDQSFTVDPPEKPTSQRNSDERRIAILKLKEAIMWLGMDLKAINEASPGAAENPYPKSYDPKSPVIEPTADGVKL